MILQVTKGSCIARNNRFTIILFLKKHITRVSVTVITASLSSAISICRMIYNRHEFTAGFSLPWFFRHCRKSSLGTCVLRLSKLYENPEVQILTLRPCETG